MWEFCEPSFYTNGCVRALVLLAVACLQKKKGEIHVYVERRKEERARCC